MATDAIDPYSQIEGLFTPERLRLVRLIESNLFCLAKEIETEEQAHAVKTMFQKPLGILNSRFAMKPNTLSNRAMEKFERRKAEKS